MFNFFRIRYNIILGVLLIWVAVLLPLGYFVTDYRQDEILASLRARGEGVASLVAFSGGEAILKFQKNRIDELVGRACSAAEIVSCSIYNQNGDTYSEYVDPGKEIGKDDIIYVEKRILNDGEYLGSVKVGVLKGETLIVSGLF